MSETLSDMYTVLYVKYTLSEFNETCCFSTDFENYSYIKFYKNPSIGSQDVPCGQTDTTS